MKEAVLKRANAIKGLNEFALKGEIVIFGSTYMANFPFYELINKSRLENAVYNRSIEGMTLEEASEVLEDCVLDLRPAKLFLSLGEEDLSDTGAGKRYADILQTVRTELPQTKVYLICLEESGDAQKRFNAQIAALCDGKRVIKIAFPRATLGKSAEYKSRFKQLSRFFRGGALTMSEAFALADL